MTNDLYACVRDGDLWFVVLSVLLVCLFMKFECYVSQVVNRRLSIQSYEGSSPQRRSYHSSSSSIASVGDELGPGPNVAEMVLHGLPVSAKFLSLLFSIAGFIRTYRQ